MFFIICKIDFKKQYLKDKFIDFNGMLFIFSPLKLPAKPRNLRDLCETRVLIYRRVIQHCFLSNTTQVGTLSVSTSPMCLLKVLMTRFLHYFYIK